MKVLSIERQTIVLLAVKGVYTNKPRPWVVVQHDAYAATDSIILCGFTHVVTKNAGLLRIDILPSDRNGLRIPCQLQVEKIVTVGRVHLGREIGRLEDHYMIALEQGLRDVLGL